MTLSSQQSHRHTDTESFAQVVKQVLAPYRSRFEAAFDQIVPSLGDEVEIRRAMAYAVQSGGKRFRPALVWMVAEALHSTVSVDRAALSVEFFHVSSLIIDDLPCMDNDDYRRGVATTHKAFAEHIAILASFALTAAGFELICGVPTKNNSEALPIAFHEASRAVGLHGLIGGQQLDLAPSDDSGDAILRLIDLKTGVLFRLCFVLGWLFGGGDRSRLDEVRQLATFFGRAFQIMDDIDDIDQDRQAGKRGNFALVFGLQYALDEVRSYIDRFCVLAQTLGLGHSALVPLMKAMRRVVEPDPSHS
jgi:geranylgeranyl pyrophosphate synthase